MTEWFRLALKRGEKRRFMLQDYGWRFIEFHDSGLHVGRPHPDCLLCLADEGLKLCRDATK
jgi:hypothetical protein